MLVGRDTELAIVGAILDRARAGRSGALVVRGEPGMGKSALLEAAVEHASGMTLLRARGVETERDLAFSGLHDLLRTILTDMDGLPDPQAAALAGALAIGPNTPGDRFTVAAATLGLLGCAAEHGPILVVVDDIQWLDLPSLEAILFAARRLGAEGVAVLIAVRDPDPLAPATPGIEELRLDGMAIEPAVALLSERSGATVPPAVAERLVSATGGNALALLELPALLTTAQLSGAEPLPDPIPTVGGLETTYRTTIDRLPADTRAALVLLAAADGAMDIVVPGLAALGLTPESLESAERAGLVNIAPGRIDFRHPLIRSAAYHGSGAGDRRAAHAALAGLLTGDRERERRAWHLSAATFGPDEEVARALEDVAISAHARRGFAVAARGFARAAELTPTADLRARRLYQAAADANLAGRPDEALSYLSVAAERTDDLLLGADIEHLRGQIEAFREPIAEVHSGLVREAARVRDIDPAKAAMMLADAAVPYLRAGDVQAGIATAREASELAVQAGERAAAAEWPLVLGLIVGGRAAEAADALARWTERLQRLASPLDDLRTFLTLPRALVWLERFDTARDLLDRLISAARASAPGALPVALAAQAELDFRTGRWDAALASAWEGLRLGDEMGIAHGVAFCLTALTRVEAGMGREADCRAHADQARDLGSSLGSGTPIGSMGEPALGLLTLGLGRPEEAVEHLEALARTCAERGIGEPGMVQYGPNLVEAYVRSGREERAIDGLAQLDGVAAATGRGYSGAGADRCRGLLAPDDAFEEPLLQAVRAFEAIGMPFERARTQLCLGERLRRVKRRADARDHLRAALSTFELLGAVPWRDRAEAELRVTGETARKRSEPPSDALTPQELQVALLVADGATNREAGSKLFLSAKTVEAHLSRIYRKLGIRSRTELAAAVLRQELPSGTPSAPGGVPEGFP